MLSSASRVLPRALRSLPRTNPLAPRAFSSLPPGVDGGIPSDDSGRQVGRRGAELEAEKEGIQLFNDQPVTPPKDAGTYDNPILVPSGDAARTVGFIDPVTHTPYWFNLRRGDVHYVEQTGLYFKMEELK
mmetsp:Transcript_12748/g.25334  ORF Transcript_12748/g.25334 Transcript_12748/m.25334 type:complete len:130 (+) Transcript_12748:39-428(+)